MTAHRQSRLWLAARAIETLVAKALAIPEVSQLARLERKDRDLLIHQWNMLTGPAASAAARVVLQGGSADDAERAARKILMTWDDAVQDAHAQAAEDAYYLGRMIGWKKATTREGNMTYDVPAIKATISPPVIEMGDVVDMAAIDALRRQQVYWIGQFYENNVQDAIRNAAREAIDQGRGQAYSSEKLRAILQNSMSSVQPPSGWKGPADQYFEGVAANAMTVGRNQGQLRSFLDLGIARFEIVNPEDDRTCPYCSHMNGKVFTTDMGTEQMSKDLAAKTPDELKNSHPWISTGALQGMSPTPGYVPGQAGKDEAEVLARAGVVMPPYHFRCRCVIDASITAGSWIPPSEEEPIKPLRVKTPRGKPAVAKPKAPTPGRTRLPWNSKAPSAPDGPFAPKEMLKDLKDFSKLKKPDQFRSAEGLAVQTRIRKQLNNLLFENGMAPHDLQYKKSNAAQMWHGNLLKKGAKPGTAGLHWSDSGQIDISEESLKRSIAWLEHITGGKQLSDWGIKPAREGFTTFLHEAIHGASPIFNWYERSFAMGKGLTSKEWEKVWRVLEEAGTEMATVKVMAKKFGIPFRELFDLKSYANEIHELESVAIHKAVKKAVEKINIDLLLVPRGHDVDDYFHIIADAAMAMRRVGVKQITNAEKYLDAFADELRLPVWMKSQMSEAQYAQAMKTMRTEFKNIVTAEANRLWTR